MSRLADNRLVSVVLAAGEGRRFGSAKQLALIEGEPMLTRVLDAVADVGGDKILVLGAHGELVGAEIETHGWRVVVAEDWSLGPGASLRAGLAVADPVEAALILLGDLAWLRPAAVRRVVEAASSRGPEVEFIRAGESGRPGHPVLIRGPLLAAARQAPDSGLKRLLDPRRGVMIDCSGLGVCRDVDRPGDLPGERFHRPAI
jgi:CTP:molybdopterin cytidylyltransferase MocA